MVKLTPDSVPLLPRHTRLKQDKVRERWLLLAPERVLVPDETAVAVLQRLDGEKTLREVAEDLAQTYAAPLELIENDCLKLLQDLADKGLVTQKEDVHG